MEEAVGHRGSRSQSEEGGRDMGATRTWSEQDGALGWMDIGRDPQENRDLPMARHLKSRQEI